MKPTIFIYHQSLINDDKWSKQFSFIIACLSVCCLERDFTVNNMRLFYIGLLKSESFFNPLCAWISSAKYLTIIASFQIARVSKKSCHVYFSPPSSALANIPPLSLSVVFLCCCCFFGFRLNLTSVAFRVTQWSQDLIARKLFTQ